MSIQLRDRIIRIQHGQELKLQVSNEICCEHSFMNPAFRQALGALLEVLRHTEAFNQEKKDIHDKERGLFEYSGNIILFAAPRGGGKTRMMLSFSHILEHPDAKIVCCSPNERCVDCDSRFSASKDPDRLKECLFFVTTPIAPAAMENGQNVLYVVLSRLYRYAEQLLDGNYANNRVSESKKNELFMAFHHCLSGINGLKQNNASPEDFTILQDISDGLSLRYHFYCLVEKILEIAAPQKGESSRYLVLQFDDADSKIDNVYTVFEDIRKYLLIPNLVILMSADVDFLHSIITQDHLKRFPDVLKYIDHDYSQDIGHIARKYIDKLIPPSHLIYLPEIYRIPVVEAKQLKLLYLDKDGKSMLNPGHEATISDDCNLDISLLNLIYQKTGILFCLSLDLSSQHYPRNPARSQSVVVFAE